MTNDERIQYKKAINVIAYKIIERPYFESMPTNEQIDAIRLAVHAMNMMAYDTGRNMDRKIAILKYHLDNPNAMLFKDRYTQDAMSMGVAALKYLIAQDGE